MRNLDAEEQQYEDEEQIKYIHSYMERKRERRYWRMLLLFQMKFHLSMAWKCMIRILTTRWER